METVGQQRVRSVFTCDDRDESSTFHTLGQTEAIMYRTWI